MNFKKNFKRFFTMSRSAEGFTLVELIVVIAILGILVGVGMPAYTGYIDKANEGVDEHNLAMMNNALVVACVYLGVEPADVSVSMNWSADGKSFLGLQDVTRTTPTTETVATVFNTSLDLPGSPIVFKKYTSSDIKLENGVFVGPNGAGNTVSGAYDALSKNDVFMNSIKDQIGAVKDSAFAGMGTDKLLGQVGNVSDMAADFIKGNSTLTAVVLDPEYIATMAGMLDKDPEVLQAELEKMFTEDPDAFSKYMANSTVLNVANTMNSMTAEQEATTKQNLATLNFGNLATTLNNDPEEGLAQAALLYGMYTAFDPVGAKDLVDTKDVSALMNLGEKKNASGQTFADYIAQVNTEGSAAAKDYAGYKSALDIVYEAADGNPDVANQAMTNGYGDSELAKLMKELIGN